MTPPPVARIGVVAIGRNEGERLGACLRALPTGLGAVVYVDSGSTDGSQVLAASLGAEVVALDMATPFTAARARNAGFAALRAAAPQVELVQFVDGDTRLAAGWIEAAAACLGACPDVAAVFGRIREARPEATIYNRLCEVEWNQAAPGDARSFAGNVLIRAAAVESAGGYDPAVIAAEDDELSVRVRRSSGRIVRLPELMAYHDADIRRFRQWWRRACRTGYAYAQVSALHGGPPDFYFVAEVRRTITWAVLVPAAGLVAAVLQPLAGSLGLIALYGLRAARTAWRCRGGGWPAGTAAAWGVACTVASFAHFQGWLRHRRDSRRGRQPQIIEHKRFA